MCPFFYIPMHLPVYQHQPWSPSKAALLSQCTKAFEYRYILRTKGLESGTESKIGTAVHRAQELILDGIEARIAIEQAIIESKNLTTSEIETVKSFTPAIINFKKKLEQFMRKHPVTHIYKEKKLAINRDFKICEYEDPDCFIRGNIDLLLVTESNHLVILDHKTGKKRPLEKHSTQLDIYTILGLVNFPTALGAQSAIHYVGYNNDVDWGPARSKAQAEKVLYPWLQSYLTDQAQRLERIEATITPLCKWCGYRTICPDWLDNGG